MKEQKNRQPLKIFFNEEVCDKDIMADIERKFPERNLYVSGNADALKEKGTLEETIATAFSKLFQKRNGKRDSLPSGANAFCVKNIEQKTLGFHVTGTPLIIEPRAIRRFTHSGS